MVWIDGRISDATEGVNCLRGQFEMARVTYVSPSVAKVTKYHVTVITTR